MTKESWIIIRRSTGEAAFETYNPNTVELVDHSKACVMTALAWLQAFNRAVAMAEETKVMPLSYASAAPVFSDVDSGATVIGQATTAAEALALYIAWYFGTGQIPARAAKACPDRPREGPVDGWIPEFTADRISK